MMNSISQFFLFINSQGFIVYSMFESCQNVLNVSAIKGSSNQFQNMQLNESLLLLLINSSRFIHSKVWIRLCKCTV